MASTTQKPELRLNKETVDWLETLPLKDFCGHVVTLITTSDYEKWLARGWSKTQMIGELRTRLPRKK